MTTSAKTGGFSIWFVLTVVLVTLKVTNVEPVADWSWIWVLGPLWMPTALVVALLLVFAVIWAAFRVFIAVGDHISESKAARKRARLQ